MPQTIRVEGVGDLQFPDGMSDDQISEAIYNNFPEQRPEPVEEAPKGPSFEQTLIQKRIDKGAEAERKITIPEGADLQEAVKRDDGGITIPDEVSPEQIPESLQRKLLVDPEVDEAVEPRQEGDDIGRMETATSQFMRGATSVLSSVPKQLSVEAAGGFKEALYQNPEIDNIKRRADAGDLVAKVAMEELDLMLDPREMENYQAADRFDRMINETFKVNPEYADEFIAGQIPQGLGSAIGFMGATVLSGPVGGAAMGYMANAQESFEDALNSGATIDDATEASKLAGVYGLSEVVPLSNLLARLDKGTGGSVTKAIKNALIQGSEEAIQESTQSIWKNLVASDLIKYDEERGVFEGTVEGGAVGFTVGSLMASIGAMLTGGRRMRMQKKLGQEMQAQLEGAEIVGAEGQAVEALSPERAQIERKSMAGMVAERLQDRGVVPEVALRMATSGQFVQPEAGMPEGFEVEIEAPVLEKPVEVDEVAEQIKAEKAPIEAAERAEERPRVAQPHGLRITEHEAKAREHGLTAEQAAAFEPQDVRDTVTGFYKAEDRVPTIKRIQEHVKSTGEEASYIEADISNLGGLNSKLGHTGANRVYRGITDIFEAELNAISEESDVVTFRHGGDEVSAMVVNATKEQVDAALESTEAKVQEYIKNEGLSDLPHPKHKGDPTKAGVGLYSLSSTITAEADFKEIFSEADQALEQQKKEKGLEPGIKIAEDRQKPARAGEPAGAAEERVAEPTRAVEKPDQRGRDRARAEKVEPRAKPKRGVKPPTRKQFEEIKRKQAKEPDVSAMEAPKAAPRAIPKEKLSESEKRAESTKGVQWYHGTDEVSHGEIIEKGFDLAKTVDSTVWLTRDLESLRDGEAGAAAHGKIVQAKIDPNKLAGWAEYEKLSIGELIRDGYDGALLDDDVVLFNPEQIKVEDREAPLKAAEKREELSATEESMGYDQPMPQWWPTFRTTGVPPRPLGDFFKIGNKKVDLKPEDKPTRREGIRVMVTDIIGPRIYQGKIKGQSRLGHYRHSNSEVRIANYDDVEVMAHEMAHFLDFHHAAAADFKTAYKSSAYKAEVADLSYTSKKETKYKEGFAEFTRLWLTNYRKAKERAPKFAEKFESIIAGDKKLNRKMIKLQAEMHRWYRQGEMAQLYGVISGNQFTAGQTVSKVLQQRPMEQARQHWIDKIHAAKVLERSVHGEIVEAEESPYKQLQLLNGIEGIVSQSFEKGALVFNEQGEITFNGPSLNDVWGESIKKGPSRIREQEAYFAARRAAELKGQGRENLISQQMITSGLALGRKYPQFKNFFTMYQTYRKNMMEFYVDSGYLDRKAADNMLKTNKNYVPFNRVIEKVDGEGRGAGGFMRLRGGTQNIKPILENMLEQDAKHIQQALKTRALRKLYSDALKSQEGSLFISRLSPDSKMADKRIVESVKGDTINRIAEVLADSGQMIDKDGNVVPMGPGDTISIQEIEEALENTPGMMNFWTHGHKPKTTETMVDSFIDYDGKLVWFEIQKENKILADMLDNMDSVALPEGVLGESIKMAMAVKRFQTLTITSMFQFAGPNIIRDQQQAFVLSGGKYKPIWGIVAGYHGMIKAIFDKNSQYHEMQAQGGPTGGRVRVQMDDTYGPEFVPDAVAKPFYYPSQMMKGLMDMYISVMDSPEMATRLGFYIRMRKEVGAREAAFQAREISTDFKKHGSYAAWVLLQRTVPFLGAYTQSIDRDIRALADKGGEMSIANLVKTERGRLKLNDLKVRIWLASSLMITIPMLLALLNDDEERYEQLTSDQKSRFYHTFINGEHYTIPKPHGFMSLAGTAGEVGVDYIKGQTSKDVADTILFASAYHFGADAMPGIINPIFELMVNKKFTGAPIINNRLKSVDPQYQYSDRTPLLYINIGEKLGISPEVANHLVKGYTGYLSDYISSATDAALWDSDAWGERPFRRDVAYLATKQFKPSKVPYRTKWTVNYYDLKKKAAAKEASLRMLTSRAMIDKDAPAKYITDRVNSTLMGVNGAFKDIDKAFKDQRIIIAAIKYNPKLTAEEKEIKIENWYKQKNKVYAAVYKKLESQLEQVEQDLEK